MLVPCRLSPCVLQVNVERRGFMNRIKFSWPKGKEGALTTSWDDGTKHDRRLTAIFNKYGLKATWNINSGIFDFTGKIIFRKRINRIIFGAKEEKNYKKYFINERELAKLFKGHEVAVHAQEHPHLWRCPDSVIFSEVVEDRRNLEKLTGYPVRGMAYPCSDTNDERVKTVLRKAGIVYSRSVENISNFELPGDFLHWTPTCHQSADFRDLWQKFLKNTDNSQKLFYLWGHSFEFARDDSWERIEEFAKLTGRNPKIWYATNMEIYSYVAAWNALSCSVNMSSIENISGETVWFRLNEKLYNIDAGKVMRL